MGWGAPEPVVVEASGTFSQKPPLQPPHYQNLAMQTQHRAIGAACDHFWYRVCEGLREVPNFISVGLRHHPAPSFVPKGISVAPGLCELEPSTTLPIPRARQEQVPSACL